MTRDEILNMPEGREMDELIAEKVMGEKKPTYSHEHPIITQTKWSATLSWYCSPEWDKGDICEWTPKHYSTCISAAWEVETKIFEDGNTVMYINELIEMVLRDEGLPIHNDWLHWFLVAHAEPVQRCRAALLATLEKV